MGYKSAAQRKAVHASKADGGKGSPTKMVSAKNNNAAIKEKKRQTRNKVKRVVQGIATGGGSEVVRKVAKTDAGKKIVKGAKKSIKRVVDSVRKAANSGVLQAGGPRTIKVKKATKGAVKGAVSGGLAKREAKRGLKASKTLVRTKVSPKAKKPSEMTTRDYENDHINKKTNQSLFNRNSKSSVLKMKTSPALAKLSASCKAAAKRKFKVYPSAYANMWASKTQKKGKC